MAEPRFTTKVVALSRGSSNGDNRLSYRSSYAAESLWEEQQQQRTVPNQPHICDYYDRANLHERTYDDEDDQSTANMSQQELIRHDVRKQRRRKPHRRSGLELLPKSNPLRHLASLPKQHQHRMSSPSWKNSSDETSSTTNTTRDGGEEEETTTSSGILRVRRISSSVTAQGSLLQLQVSPTPKHRVSASPAPLPHSSAIVTPSPPSLPPKRTPPPTYGTPSAPLRRFSHRTPLPPTPPRVRFLPDDHSSVPFDPRLDDHNHFVHKSILKTSTFGHPAEKHAPPVNIATRHHLDDTNAYWEEEPRAYYYHPHDTQDDSFLENVAAIVVQTCIRRFLAIRTVVRMILEEERQQEQRREQRMQQEQRREQRIQQEQRQRIQQEQRRFKQQELMFQQEKQALRMRDTQQMRQIHFEDHDQREPEQDVEEEDSLELFHLAARVIQMAYARYRRKLTKAAIILQRVFRGYWTRDCLSIDNYCATTLQALGRGYLVRMMMKPATDLQQRQQPHRRPTRQNARNQNKPLPTSQQPPREEASREEPLNQPKPNHQEEVVSARQVRDIWSQRAKNSAPVLPTPRYG